MKHIPLTKGLTALVDDADYEWLSQWKWCATHTKSNIYAKRQLSTAEGLKLVYMHRAIMGVSDRAITIDHIDGNGLNNQRSNLRIATNAQNTANSKLRSNNKSGRKGVYWSVRDGKWRAQICVSGTNKYLGDFASLDAAHEAYVAAARKHFGEFARIP